MRRPGGFLLILAALALFVGLASPDRVLARSQAPDLGTPVFAAQEHEEPASAPAGDQFDERILWSLLAVLLVVPAGGIFYLLKKRLGAFPENPEWVAPISIMRSRDLPDEHTYAGSDAPVDAHGHH